MSDVTIPCATCRHFHQSNTDDNTCDAFLDGVPVPILIADKDHRQPYPGDNGIQYEAVTE